MMKMAITACAAVLVAGCGSEKSGPFETEDGESGTYTVDQSGEAVTMAAGASPEDMIAHYRRQAEAAGVDLELDMTTDTMRMIGGKAPDGSAFSFTATAGADGTTGQLMVGQASQ